MKQSQDLIHTPVIKGEGEQKCLQCGHDCHCGDVCHNRSCHCGKCVHHPDEVVDENNSQI